MRFLVFLEAFHFYNPTAMIERILWVGSSCQATLNRGLRLLASELKKAQNPSVKAELHRVHSDLVVGPVVGSHPLTRSQKRTQPGGEKSWMPPNRLSCFQ